MALDCGRDQSRLQNALQSWLICDGEPDAADSLRQSDGGTLFLDEIHALDLSTQKLLLILVRRMDGCRAGDRRFAGPTRLAAGSPEDLKEAVRQNRFSGALLDSLDKIRVELGRIGSRGAA